MVKTRVALLSAGGTGGHLFPAQALAHELKARGWIVHLATDPRAQQYIDDFPADGVHIVESATFSGKSPAALARTAWRLAMGYVKSWRLIGKLKPDVAVGFGGYPTVPPLLAATHRKIPSVLHEQNAVIGRANRFLGKRVTAIATGFKLAGHDVALAPVTVTGNPLRPLAHEAAEKNYDAPQKHGPFKLLVFGGSQGARYFSQTVPKALALLAPDLAFRLRLVLQARPEDAVDVRSALGVLEIDAQVEEFFTDLPQRIADSHLVICRAGASSVSELALIGRPSILVPLPGSLDDDQGANAARLEAEGGAQLIRQAELTPEAMCDLLKQHLENPDGLALQAKNAKKAGVPRAAANLADLVEHVAGR